MPRRAVGVRAVLDQRDPLGTAVGGDLLDVERDVAADVHQENGMRLVLVDLALEVVERHAEVVPVAVDELDPAAGGLDRQWCGHERVRGAEDGSPAHLEEFEGGERGAGPVAHRDGGEAVPGAPRVLELAGDRALRPLLGIERGLPEGMQTHAVAVVEADGERIEVHEPAGDDPKRLGPLRGTNHTNPDGFLNRGGDRGSRKRPNRGLQSGHWREYPSRPGMRPCAGGRGRERGY